MLQPGDLPSYVGGPAPVARVRWDSGVQGWVDDGWASLPKGFPCFVIERDRVPGMWIVLVGEKWLRVHEKFLAV